MAKAKKTRQVKKLTKKQLSRRKRERQQLLWIWIGVGIVVAVVIALPIVGLISQSTRAMAVVNGQKIKVADYQRRVRFFYHYLGPELFQSSEAEQQTMFYQQIADQLVEEALVQQEAEKQGLSVTDDEVQIEVEETWFQHYRIPPTPTPSPTPDPEAMPTEEGTPRPTPTPDTEEAFQSRYQEFLENVLKPARLQESYFRELVKASLLAEKLEVAVVTNVPTEEDQVYFRYATAQDAEDAGTKIASFQSGVVEQVNARHILVETQEEAEAILKRLEAGEDFAALAAELSMDTSNKDEGGDLGWFSRGQMVPEFDEAAFGAEIGLYPTPVQTQFGYHVIEVLGHEDRPVDLDEAMFDMGWYGKQQLVDQFGPLFAEMVFGADIGLLTDPVPTSFGVAVVEVLEREVRLLDETERTQRRASLFQAWLDEVREEGDIQDLWEPNMVPNKM